MLTRMVEGSLSLIAENFIVPVIYAGRLPHGLVGIPWIVSTIHELRRILTGKCMLPRTIDGILSLIVKNLIITVNYPGRLYHGLVGIAWQILTGKTMLTWQTIPFGLHRGISSPLWLGCQISLWQR